MSPWAGPYLQVIDAGHQVSWTPEVDLPLTPADGASLADLGAPGAKVRVRWRTPLHTNPRSLTGPASAPDLLALACCIRAAVAAAAPAGPRTTPGPPCPSRSTPPRPPRLRPPQACRRPWPTTQSSPPSPRRPPATARRRSR